MAPSGFCWWPELGELSRMGRRLGRPPPCSELETQWDRCWHVWVKARRAISSRWDPLFSGLQGSPGDMVTPAPGRVAPLHPCAAWVPGRALRSVCRVNDRLENPTPHTKDVAPQVALVLLWPPEHTRWGSERRRQGLAGAEAGCWHGCRPRVPGLGNSRTASPTAPGAAAGPCGVSGPDTREVPTLPVSPPAGMSRESG